MNFNVKKIKPEIGYYLAGFTDAEGSFFVSFSPKTNKESTIITWSVKPIFSICQKERHIIAQFKKHLQCGTVYTNIKTSITTYTVSNLHALRAHVVPFFNKYGFHSAKKKKDFSNFCKILDILQNPILTKIDIEKILSFRINTKAIIENRNYSEEIILSSLTKNIHIDEIKQSSETNMPNSENTKNILNEMIESDLYGDIKAENALKLYIAGFVDGDGSFNVSFRKRDDYTIGWKINPSFSVAQKDKILLHLFQKQLDCGKIREGSSQNIFYLEVLNLNDLRNKVVPFFKAYPLLSESGKEKFERFCKTLDILSLHPLSRSNVEEILQLQRNQNKKTRYTSQQILDRFDYFFSRKNVK